ncbi:MAG: HNH endonuclease, partial [Pyrinomonadaceae bacterium]
FICSVSSFRLRACLFFLIKNKDTLLFLFTLFHNFRYYLRGFRQAVIEAYDYQCSFCGLKLSSPDSLAWEVEAAHIVPNMLRGKDDIWNGLALCRTHHWAFDVGWITLSHRFIVRISSQVEKLPAKFGKMESTDLIRMFKNGKTRIRLPVDQNLFPHESALNWHRTNRFVL